jgi:hypothetical protein
MKIKLREEQYNKIIKELYKSTYNSAASEAMERGDEELALDFLKHSNEMGIPKLKGVYPPDVDGDGDKDAEDAKHCTYSDHCDYDMDGYIDDSGEPIKSYNPSKVVHKDGEHVVLDLDQDEDEFTYDEDDISYQDNDWLVIDVDDGDKTNYDFYGVGPSDIDADGIPDNIDDELSVDRFDIRQRIQSELNTMLHEGERNTRNYMFFSNLKQMRRQIDMMLENFNPHWVDSLLCDGHDWADDKISESKTNIDSVFDFFMNKKEK